MVKSRLGFGPPKMAQKWPKNGLFWHPKPKTHFRIKTKWVQTVSTPQNLHGPNVGSVSGRLEVTLGPQSAKKGPFWAILGLFGPKNGPKRLLGPPACGVNDRNSVCEVRLRFPKSGACQMAPLVIRPWATYINISRPPYGGRL